MRGFNNKNPLTKGLTAACAFNEFGSNGVTVFGRHADYRGTIYSNETVIGPSVWQSGMSTLPQGHGSSVEITGDSIPDPHINIPNNEDTSPTNEITVFLLFDMLDDDNTNEIRWLFDSANTGNTEGVRLFKGNSAFAGVDQFRFRVPGTTSENCDSGAQVWNAGDTMSCCGTYDNADIKIYVNGGLENTVASTGGITASTVPVLLGEPTGFAAYAGNQRYRCMLVFNRALSAIEIAALHENPWQVFAPQRIIIPVFPYVPIDIEAPAGDTISITLVNDAGDQLANLTGLSWSWADESTIDTANAPTASGTGATTDANGLLTLDITGTSLTTGQTGMLSIMDSSGYIYALYRITLT